MHPYLADQVAAAHRDDLRRAALATYCANLIARLSLRDRFAAATGRLAAAFGRPTPSSRATMACCAA